MLTHQKRKRTQTAKSSTTSKQHKSSNDISQAKQKSKPLNHFDLFTNHYQREYGFILDRPVLVDDIRIRAIGHSSSSSALASSSSTKPTTQDSNMETTATANTPPLSSTIQAYFEDGFKETKVYDLKDASTGQQVEGPAILCSRISTIVVEPVSIELECWMLLFDTCC